MKKGFYEKFIKRATQFFKDACYDAEYENYDIAMVHLEQALQLLLKAKIYEKFEEFPSVHSLKILLRKLGEQETLKEHRSVITLLETAYLAGRYYNVDYEKEDFEMVLKFVKSMFEKYGVRID